MGRRSGGSNKSRPGNKKQSAEPYSSANTQNDSIEEDLLDSLMFKPMPPNKRNELNLIVKKLLNLVWLDSLPHPVFRTVYILSRLQ